MAGQDDPVYDEVCLDAYDGAAVPQWNSHPETGI